MNFDSNENTSEIIRLWSSLEPSLPVLAGFTSPHIERWEITTKPQPSRRSTEIPIPLITKPQPPLEPPSISEPAPLIPLPEPLPIEEQRPVDELLPAVEPTPPAPKPRQPKLPEMLKLLEIKRPLVVGAIVIVVLMAMIWVLKLFNWTSPTDNLFFYNVTLPPILSKPKEPPAPLEKPVIAKPTPPAPAIVAKPTPPAPVVVAKPIPPAPAVVAKSTPPVPFKPGTGRLTLQLSSPAKATLNGGSQYPDEGRQPSSLLHFSDLEAPRTYKLTVTWQDGRQKNQTVTIRAGEELPLSLKPD